jgi:2-oxoglutarate ferredoxin oxidoreductase subunit alpha
MEVAVKRRLSLEDISIMAGGQGGDGTITVVALLADIFRKTGLYVYTGRNVLSRIKGGHADGVMRASVKERYTVGDHLGLLIAFDKEAVAIARDHLSEDSMIVFDSSGGSLTQEEVKPGVQIYNAPFSRTVMRHLRRDLFKNSLAFAVAGRALGLTDESMREAMQARYGAKGGLVIKYNMKGLELGLELADQLGLHSTEKLIQVKGGAGQNSLLITGNDALAFGFLVAGGRFFAGYPITPATDVMEWLAKYGAKFGCVVKQAEDELSSINMAIGAALSGARAMVSTSGPGISLMQEGIGQAGAAEIPVVIVDCQRSGPSTGMPTKVEQSDIQLMVYGGHGDFPRIVLTPGTPTDCFYLGALAPNLAEKYQCPVYVALDQALSQNLGTVPEFDFSRIVIDRGKRLTERDLVGVSKYSRYMITEDGISPYTVPSTEGGLWLVTGNEHDEWGHVSTNRKNRIQQMNKRMRKLELVPIDLPESRLYGDPHSDIGIIGVGCTFGPIIEAMEQMEAQGVKSKYLQPLAIWPLREEIISFVRDCRSVFVVEHNYVGQIADLLKLHSGRT